MTLFILILLITALVLFLLAGFGTPTRFNLIGFGLAALTLAVLLRSGLLA